VSAPPPQSIVRGRRLVASLLVVSALFGAAAVAVLLVWLVPLALDAFL